ncbi:hypothetical protein [Micromonospora matsumotoense]|uniref:hypothetical protein n=1 Tax=Micromonospora matsumotoense TaxID=121616 RepID=UPI0033CF5E95
MLAPDMELGAGNVLLRLAEHGADLDEPRIAIDTPVDGVAPFTLLSLRELTRLAAARVDWFRGKGIGRRDPVALYVTDAADVFLNFVALCRLGAIPALMNGNLPLEFSASPIWRWPPRPSRCPTWCFAARFTCRCGWAAEPPGRAIRAVRIRPESGRQPFQAFGCRLGAAGRGE